MAEETLLSAARRVVRFFNIDEAKGGLMTTSTVAAIETLDRMVRHTTEREKTDLAGGCSGHSILGRQGI